MNAPTNLPSIWGVLESTAPGLAGAVRRTFSPEAALTIAATYAEVIERSGLETPAIRRPEGTSFNPRPARICQILLTEGGGASPEELQQAVRRSLPHGDTPPNYEPYDPHDRVALALALDDVRHLHMTDEARCDRRAMLAHARALCSAGSPTERLTVLVHHAVQRYVRSHGEPHE